MGELGPVLQEQIRFRHDPSLGFSSGDVSDVVLRQVPVQEDDELARRPLFEVVTTFLGLTGSASPLPMYVAEEVAQEDPDRPVRREFLDLFHHRLLSLLFRIESRYRVTTELTSTCDDQWSRRILALAGFDTFEQAWPGKLPAWRMLRIAPILASYVLAALFGAVPALLRGQRKTRVPMAPYLVAGHVLALLAVLGYLAS